MIQLSRNYSLPEKQEDDLAIKIIGVGGAGTNALDRIVLDGLEYAEMIAVSTDVQSLASSVANRKVQIGREATRGLGAGGDPELGFDAANESVDELREVLQGARMVFICAGLGGGTGSGAAPTVAQIARETGALVLAFATLPFAFEGKRRAAQAAEALAELRRDADAVVCFENDRMGGMVLPKAGIHQAFAVADTTISQSVRAIVNVVRRPGLIQIGFDELLSALRSKDGRCLFGYGESESDNRAHEALALALKNPLMNRGKILADARHVLVQIAGGPGMTLTEVEIVMQELNRHIEDHTQILFGTSVDGKMGNRMSVTLISSIAAEGAQPAVPLLRTVSQVTAAKPVVESPSTNEPMAQDVVAKSHPEPALAVEATPVAIPLATDYATPEAVGVSTSDPQLESIVDQPKEKERKEVALPAAEIAPPPRTARKERKPVPSPQPEVTPEPAAAEPPPAKKGKFVQARQEVMQFEPVTRGRFEKSEPTIVEGQDLDVPTYLRKNARVK